jgi:RecA-family ATPase
MALRVGLEPDPDNLYGINKEDILISLQKKAFQDRDTLQAALERALASYNAKLPHNKDKDKIWLTDGQSSRFTVEVMAWCRENGIWPVIYPPHTTQIHAPLVGLLSVDPKSCNVEARKAPEESNI